MISQQMMAELRKFCKTGEGSKEFREELNRNIELQEECEKIFRSDKRAENLVHKLFKYQWILLNGTPYKVTVSGVFKSGSAVVVQATGQRLWVERTYLTAGEALNARQSV